MAVFVLIVAFRNRYKFQVRLSVGRLFFLKAIEEGLGISFTKATKLNKRALLKNLCTNPSLEDLNNHKGGAKDANGKKAYFRSSEGRKTFDRGSINLIRSFG